ncbi:MAG: rhodanese-related sulfurtransferase [Bacteroidia bacterium]|nr:rhodanese-related sulfurtransferase [Bacteroidia bacterium]
MAILANKKNKTELLKELEAENFKRITISFYRYVEIKDPKRLRDELYLFWDQLRCKGRIYLAHEGINAQMSVPEHNFENFKHHLYSYPEFIGIPFKFAVEEKKYSFLKLVVKVRKKIVADGIDDPDFKPWDTGQYLNAEEFNRMMELPDAIVVDMRNHYESEVGHFEGAILPDADTFREEIPIVAEMLAEHKDKPVLMYCTGGIRCEKASAYLKYKGFKKVYHLQGGIIQYAREVREKNLKSKFIGLNFVFDERMGERITPDIIANCHQCGKPCDRHVNCKNDACHLLFIQCEECEGKMNGCCSDKCREVSLLPPEVQKALRKGKITSNPHQVFNKSKKNYLLKRFENQLP